MSRLAVAALQNLISDSEIRMLRKVDLYRLWESMSSENEYMLKRMVGLLTVLWKPCSFTCVTLMIG